MCLVHAYACLSKYWHVYACILMCRVAISNWLKKSQKSPKTNALLPSKQLLPNHALKSMIIEWLERHPDYKD